MNLKSHRHLLMPVVLLGAAAGCHAEIVAHYKFDEAAAATTALNAIPTGPTGAVGSAVTTGVAGIAGNAYSFPGATATQADIVDMENASFFTAINASGRFSFSAWVRTADTTGGRNTVVFAGDNTQANVYADLGVAAAQAGFLGSASARNRPVGAPAGAQQTGIYSSPAVPPVNDDTWHHLVMTVDVATARLELWVDGILANSQIMGAAALPIFNNFEIGRLGRGAPVDPYQGLVDDVQVYDHVLSPFEIAFIKKFPGEPYVDVDTDIDGLNDSWEKFYFGNITSQSGGDIGPDADGATNLQEYNAGTNPLVADTDGDGRTDGAELNIAPLTDPADPDSDDDGLTDGAEVSIHGTDPNNADSDFDNLPDAWEISNQLNPLSGDGDDGDFGDPDQDGLLNSGEYNYGISSSDPHDSDTDNDGYSDLQEDRFGSWGSIDATGTSPINPDTDGDGLPDGQENPDLDYVPGVTSGTDPNLPDTDVDGFSDKVEFLANSDPTDAAIVPTVPRGLVAHYKFNEAAAATTAVNAAGGGSPGAVGTAVITGVAGIAGNAYQFSNLFGQNDIVDMGNAPFLEEIRATKALTYTAWIKSTDTSTGRNTIISASDNLLDNSYVDCGIAGATPPVIGAFSGRLRPNGNVNTTELFSNTAPHTALVNTDTWHHVALTIDLVTHTQRIYVDGVPCGENSALVTAAFPVFNNFEIGRLGRKVPTDAYQGLIDDVQVYNEALSPSRIASLFTMPGVSADEDHDRLDDQWEITHFGSITAQNGSGDPDNDGILNEAEETGGTHPGGIVLTRITSAGFVGGSYVIQFTGAPSTTYRVTKSTTLVGGSFAEMVPPVTATTNGSGSGTATVPAAGATGPRGFFRLETP